MYRAEALIEMLRKKLNERGTKGLFGLLRCFKLIDKDKSNTLTLDEFKQVMKEYKLAFDEQDTEIIFKEFDRDRNAFISQDEFIRALRVPLIYSKFDRAS